MANIFLAALVLAVGVAVLCCGSLALVGTALGIRGMIRRQEDYEALEPGQRKLLEDYATKLAVCGSY